MPHLTVEYTANLTALDTPALLQCLNKTLLASGQFEELDIKSRAVALDCFRVGNRDSGQAFVHAKLAILSGRSEAVKQQLSAALLAELQGLQWPTGLSVQLCVEILDIHRPSYAKATVTA